MYRHLCVSLLLILPTAGFGASREIQELQRDIGLLQQAVQQLQRSQDEKLAALTELVRQSLDASNRANTAVAVIESNIRQGLRDQEKSVAGPVVAVGAKIDQMSNDFRTLQQAVADITSLMGKLQAQVTDLSNAVKIMQAPPPPPPNTGTGAPQGAVGAPPMPATDLYNNALRDRSGGKVELALQGFTDYLKYYGNTELAPNAQFYIADIHFSQGDLENALKEFDMVLEKYQDNNKTPDALYMKGLTLVKMGRRTQGAEEFKELIKRFPNSDLSKKACSQLTGMGLKCGPGPRAAAPAAKKTAKKSRK
jgi:tol-pal system protein YbgF